MNSLSSRFTAHLVTAGFALLALASVARAQITFTVDTFTTDELTITLNPSTLSGSASHSIYQLSLYGAVGENFGSTYLPPNSWITSDGAAVSETAPGSIGAVNFVTGSSAAYASSAYGPFVQIGGAGPIAEGSSIASPYQITFSGSGIFDLSTITEFRLYWGLPGSSGVLQSTASASAVPEPSTYAVIFGALTLLGTIFVRRRRR